MVQEEKKKLLQNDKVENFTSLQTQQSEISIDIFNIKLIPIIY